MVNQVEVDIFYLMFNHDQNIKALRRQTHISNGDGGKGVHYKILK